MSPSFPTFQSPGRLGLRYLPLYSAFSLRTTWSPAEGEAEHCDTKAFHNDVMVNII